MRTPLIGFQLSIGKRLRFMVVFLCAEQVIGDAEERILVMGATNRPQELDDAALRYDLETN